MLSIDDYSASLIRLATFASVFFAMALLEILAPRRQLKVTKFRRWMTNLTIGGLGIAIVRGLGMVAQPLVAVGAALLVETSGFGLLNFVVWPFWLEILIAVVVLDFAIWLQHLISHRSSMLWRLHRVHHADVDIDVSTALRFHPVEIGLSMLYKVGWVLLLGPSVVAVVLFEVILNACAMFSHANVALPSRLDRALRAFLVTPDLHRVHHSVLKGEHHSNFGFNLSIWDRLFGTYVAQPEHGHEHMTIGLPAYQSDAPTRLGWSLLLPFKRSANGTQVSDVAE